VSKVLGVWRFKFRTQYKQLMTVDAQLVCADRDQRFTSAFWTRLIQLLGTRLCMTTAVYPETDGQTERANRVVEDVLCSNATSYRLWNGFLPMVEFARNNSVHASTGLTPFYVNNGQCFILLRVNR
jgi:hypothetical protein